MMKYYRVDISGIVQGVGFRPFVYRIARERGIAGSVSNTSTGVEVRACGEERAIDGFLDALEREAPPQSCIEEFRAVEAEPFVAHSFEISPSRVEGDKSVLISPDLATCADCVRELFDPGDRRYRYPFINCTNCGPRFTIIEDTPYDRPLTSMSVFEMCSQCAREYEDPSDRRFHAQPNACPACGPRLWLADREGEEMAGDPIRRASELLMEGRVVAVKGLGGFQLACDATSDEAVFRLRARKNRYGKPFAVMVGAPEEAGKYCHVSDDEGELLRSPAAPIVLLPEREDSPISREVAAGLDHQGLFLPYTPIHHLLMAEVDVPLVMTSGNLSSEPIAKDNQEALEVLGGIADYFLLHDRDILVRYDDSVTRVFEGDVYPVRRARGYAPYPVRISPPSGVEVMALGPELKNTFCLLRKEHAFVGQHIGDMETREEVRHFEEALATVARLFDLKPQVVAHDLHPDYLTTRMAFDLPQPRVGVQHHHAHIVSCMTDNRVQGRVIGVSWDGTGYGEDGTVWGGEFLVCDELGYERAAHLLQYPMPGADACIHRPYRMVMGVLKALYSDCGAALGRLENLFDIEEDEIATMLFQLENNVNCPLTSSAGRVFDAVAALAGLRQEVQYDGQAGMELEAVAAPGGKPYGFEMDRKGQPWVVDTRPLFLEVLEDIKAGTGAVEIAGRFHETMARIIISTCEALGEESGTERVALSGGVFQNMMLTSRVVEGLRGAGLAPLLHRRVPCNDGGISLGQAVVAARRIEAGLDEPGRAEEGEMEEIIRVGHGESEG